MHDDRDLLHKIIRSLREPVQFGPAFDARVMRAVRGMPRHARDTLWSRLTTPRTITVTPLSWGRRFSLEQVPTDKHREILFVNAEAMRVLEAHAGHD